MTDPTDIPGQIEEAMEPLARAYANAKKRLNELLAKPRNDENGNPDLAIVPAIRLAAEMSGKLVQRHEVSPGSSALDEIPADELRAMAVERERILMARPKMLLEEVNPSLKVGEIGSMVLRSRTERTGG